MTKMEVAYISKEGNCLQDVHIAAAGALLKSSFPERAGFQSTLYSPECWQSQGEETIQMHFDAKKQHWTTSTYGGNIIRYFDSLYNGYLTDDIRQQLMKLYGHLMKTPTVQVVRVQQQQGSTDCGLFAIAYAVHLAFNQDPARAKFSQSAMRIHFVQCLKQQKMEPFPIEKTLAHVARPDIILI